MTTAQSSISPAAHAYLNLLHAHWTVQSIHVAAKLRVADLLGAGPMSVDELAARTDSHAGAFYRLLRVLAGIGLVTEDPVRHFALTPLGAYLQSDHPHSQRAAAIWVGEGWAWETARHLVHSVKTGKSAFSHIFGQGFFDLLRTEPNAAQLFDQAMTSLSAAFCEPIAAYGDLAAARTVVDVGGGCGRLLMHLLKIYPQMEGVLLDRPDTIEAAKAAFEAEGLAARCQYLSGDFFEFIPQGGDLYLLKHVLHDWDDERAATILDRCREAMGPAARLLIVEEVIQPGNEPSPGRVMDLIMLAMLSHGRERTEEEFRRLITAAGLRLLRIIETGAPIAIIEAAP